MRNYFLQKFLLSFLCLAWLCAIAQQPFYRFDQFDKAADQTEGVSHIEQDDEGFFWYGTANGLFRFDGVQAVKINYLTSDSLPASALNIFMLSWDAKNQLVWLATEYGVFKYDPRSGASEHLQAKDLFEEKDIHKLTAHLIFTDRQGDTWASFGVYGLVKLFAKAHKAEVHFLPVSEQEKAAGMDWRLSNSITSIQQDANNDHILWLGTRRGLMKFDKAEKRLERFFFNTSNEKMLMDANAMPCLYAHPNGKIYAGTWNAGMLVFDPATQQFSQSFPSPGGWTVVSDKNHVYRILPDGTGNLWVSCDAGLMAFDVRSNTFSEPVANHHLHFKDRAGNYWQYWGGLRLFHRIKNQMLKMPVPAELNCNYAVSGVPFDAKNRQVYLRSHCQGGLRALDVDRNTWQHYPLPGRAGQEVEMKGYESAPSGMFFSDEKLRLYFKPHGAPQFQLVPSQFPQEAGNFTIESRADGHVFVCGTEGWLFWFKPGSWQPKVFNQNSAGDAPPDHFNGVAATSFDAKGRLWMRTSGGYSIFSPEEDRFIHVSKKDKNGRHLIEYFDFIPDGEGRMWATSGDGFGWIDPLKPEEGLKKAFNETTGFPYHEVSVLFTVEGKMWLTSNEGLVEFDPKTGQHRLFEHLTGRNIKYLNDGRVIEFFDNSYGIFHLDSLRQNEELPKPYVSWLKVFEKPMPLPGSLLTPAEVRLKPDENFFSIGFSAIGFYDPHKFRFAYQLEGLNKDWIYPDPGVLATSYTNIEGGDYVFKIKVSNSRGEWSGQAFALPIHVGTVWYKTLWARLALLILLGAAARLAYQFQKRRWQTDAELKIQSQESRRLAELDAFKTRFFTNITHEFRTPLAVILGNAELGKLEAEKPPISQFQISNFNTIARNGKQLLELVNQMLDLARLESGKLVLNERQSDVMAFVKITVEAFHSLAISKKQNLACMTEPGELLMDFDPQRLQQVLGNLVTNALKFTSEFGSVKVTARLLAAAKTLQIEVEDTGHGIAAQDLPQIFDRFYQVENAQNATGTGIGLALAKELVQHIGGSITVESKVGEGSKFTLALPVTNVAEVADFQSLPMEIPAHPADEILSENSPELPLLLHVEDHPDLLRYLRNLLGGSYQIISARSGTEGLEKALEQVPDLILSDVMMPGMDGFELCEKLKSDLRTSHIPVVLLTAKATVQDKIEGLQQGADAYLMKPFQREELLATLKNLLENRRRLAAFLSLADPSPDVAPEAAKEHEFLQKIRAIIDQNLSDETYDMTRLSHDLAMSRMQIYRKLTALTGKPASLFVRSHRLQKAKTLLESSSLTVSEIAYRTGFSDHTYFSKCFKEEFGVTPSYVRK